MFILLSLSSGNEVTELTKAIELYDSGEYGKAIESLREVIYSGKIQDFTKIAQARLYLGFCYFKLGLKEEAIFEFGEALKLNKDLELDPEYFAPELVELFRLAKERLAEFQEKLKAPSVVVIKEKPIIIKEEPKVWGISNFLPGGIPQFHQGKKRPGMFFLIGQILAFTTSGIAYALERSYYDSTYNVPKKGEDNYNKCVRLRKINQTAFWTGVAIYLTSVVESLISK